MYNKLFMKSTKPNLEIGDRVWISKKDVLFRKWYKTQFTDNILEILAVSTKKFPTYIIKDLEKEEIMGKFHEKELRKRSN